MWTFFLFGIFLFYEFSTTNATIECAPPIFRKRLLRKLASNTDDHLDDHSDKDHDTEGPQVLYFFCTALILGAVTSYLLQRWNSKVPYTVVMFAEGMIAAVIYMHFDKAADDKYPPIEDMFDSIEDWGDINPIYLLYMFIPILTFTDALNLPWVELTHIYKHSMLLAVSSSACVICIIGGFMQLLVPHWKLVLSFLFSSCLAANDPVSVVPLMHTAGASHSLMILILGESLLTEGFATVGFHLFGERIMECDSTFSSWNIVQLIIKDFFFSPLVGVIIGLLTCLCMNFVNQPYRDLDTIIQITLQIFCAYFSFYLAEFEYEVSGVFSVVGAGIVYASFAQKSVLRHNLVDSIWHSMEWLASTLMFLFSGVVMVYTGFHRVSWKFDIFVIVSLYLLLSITRIISVLIISPFFNYLNDKHHPSLYGVNEMKFLSVTGIKGAITVILILGVIEYQNIGFISRDDMEEFLVYGCGLVTLNQFFTGTWTYYTLKYFSLLPIESEEEKIIMRFMRHKIRKELYNMNESSTNNLNYSIISISMLRTLKSIDILANESQDIQQLYQDIEFLTSSPQQQQTQQPPREYNHELYRVLKMKYLESIYSLYLHDISIGRLQRNSYPAQRLLNSIDHIRNDHHLTTLTDWELIQEYLQINQIFYSFLNKFIDPILLIFSSTISLSQAYLEIYEKWKVYILTSYISAHRRSSCRMEHYLSLDIENIEDEENARKTAYSIPELRTLLEQSEELIKLAEYQLEQCNPKDVVEISNLQTANSLIHMQASLILRLRDEGLLSQKDAVSELETIMANEHELNKNSLKLDGTIHKHHMSPFVSRQSSATLPVHNPSISLSVLPTTAQNDFSFSQSRKSNLFSHRLHDSRASNLLDRPHGSYLPRMTLMSALEQNQNQERHSTTLTYHSPTTRDSAILRGTNGGGGQLNESLLHGEHNDHNNNDYDL